MALRGRTFRELGGGGGDAGAPPGDPSTAPSADETAAAAAAAYEDWSQTSLSGRTKVLFGFRELVNARIEGAEIVYQHYHDIGVAVSTERGLMVPVLRDTGAMSFADIERQIAELAQKARDGKITVNDRPLDEFFGRETGRMIVRQPLELVQLGNKFDITVSVSGGGIICRKACCKRLFTKPSSA